MQNSQQPSFRRSTLVTQLAKAKASFQAIQSDSINIASEQYQYGQMAALGMLKNDIEDIPWKKGELKNDQELRKYVAGYYAMLLYVEKQNKLQDRQNRSDDCSTFDLPDLGGGCTYQSVDWDIYSDLYLWNSTQPNISVDFGYFLQGVGHGVESLFRGAGHLLHGGVNAVAGCHCGRGCADCGEGAHIIFVAVGGACAAVVEMLEKMWHASGTKLATFGPVVVTPALIVKSMCAGYVGVHLLAEIKASINNGEKDRAVFIGMAALVLTVAAVNVALHVMPGVISVAAAVGVAFVAARLLTHAFDKWTPSSSSKPSLQTSSVKQSISYCTALFFPFTAAKIRANNRKAGTQSSNSQKGSGLVTNV